MTNFVTSLQINIEEQTSSEVESLKKKLGKPPGRVVRDLCLLEVIYGPTPSVQTPYVVTDPQTQEGISVKCQPSSFR